MSGPGLAIDGTSVPRPREDVACVILDGEAVIHRAGRVHTLDPLATLVWRCCDRDASVDEIASELAEVFATPLETVRRDVSTVVEQLAALGLLTANGVGADRDVDASAVGSERLVHPPGSCASCADKRWATSATFRIGPHLISVGTDSSRADTAMREVLAAHLVDTRPVPAPPFFAVTFPEAQAATGPQSLYLLQQADSVVARSRRPDDVMRALATHLATYGELRALGLATVNGLVVGHGDRAMLVPEPDDPIRYRHALARQGVLVADMPVAIVDPERHEVVVGAPGIRFDESALGSLTDGSAFDSTAGTEALPWGRYRLLALGVAGPPSGSEALLRFGPVRGDHRDHDAGSAALLSLLAAVPVVEAIEPDVIGAFLARA